jgi:hypothetical protein
MPENEKDTSVVSRSKLTALLLVVVGNNPTNTNTHNNTHNNNDDNNAQ